MCSFLLGIRLGVEYWVYILRCGYIPRCGTCVYMLKNCQTVSQRATLFYISTSRVGGCQFLRIFDNTS